MSGVLIAPKGFALFEPEEYHDYVKGMYELRQKKGKAASPTPGIALSRTKKGALSIRHTKAQRPIRYVTAEELKLLAEAHSVSQRELWNLFKQKEFLITQTRMDAERIYAEINEIPF